MMKIGLLTAVFAALLVAALCKDPPPPTVREQSTSGRISTADPTGRLMQFDFQMKVQPETERAKLSFIYFFTPIEVAWEGNTVTISISGQCEQDYGGDYPFKEDVFYGAQFGGTESLSTPYHLNVSVSHFRGQLDVPFGLYDYYYYYYDYYYDEYFYFEDSYSYSSSYFRGAQESEAAEEREVSEATRERRRMRKINAQEQVGAQENDGETSGEEQRSVEGGAVAPYDLFTETYNPDFIVRWVVYQQTGLPGTVIDYNSYDYSHLTSSDLGANCFFKRDDDDANDGKRSEEWIEAYAFARHLAELLLLARRSAQ